MEKPVHTLVLDTGAIIKNEPPVSTLINQAETLVTVPSIISEIKDAATRSRVETTLQPFLSLRSPKPESIKFVTDFARRTGDLTVLSKPDIQIIALTYEIECERNHGDWRLRRTPGQKRVNGPPPANHSPEPKPSAESNDQGDGQESREHAHINQSSSLETRTTSGPIETSNVDDKASDATVFQSSTDKLASASLQENTLESQTQQLDLNSSKDEKNSSAAKTVDKIQTDALEPEPSNSISDSDDWITPSNLKRVQAREGTSSTTPTPEPKTMQVAVLTTDFAMQNVILQINLNLLSPSMSRVKHIKTYVLRCHACFQVSKDLTKQFCPRCGQPTLTRVSCSTNANGEFKLHLKKNMQWNHRGDRYSIPKPVHGSPNGRVKGGGKGGWGNELIFTEDQKEYQNATGQQRKQKERDLMDDDFLPSILTGERGKMGGKVRVGAGRNVNSKKR